jgi:hypothetical protein
MLIARSKSKTHQPWRLAECWAHRDVVVVTPADLSRPGWRLRCGRPSDARAAIGGREFRGEDVDAAVSMLPAVSVYDMPHVAERDREYVANEMSAFLLAWLTQLKCPVVDRPTPSSLSGCGRLPAHWVALARRAGVPGAATWTDPPIEVTVVGGRAVDQGQVSALSAAAEAVVQEADRSLVTLQFAAGGEPMLVGAAARPEAGSPVVAKALLGWLESL